MKDHTKNYDYEELIREEKEHYSDIEVTENLTEGGVHAQQAWGYYWQGVFRVIGETPFHNMAGHLDETFGSRGRPIRILSLGSGYCGHELALARNLKSEYSFMCTDVNEKLFAPAMEVARQENLRIEFRTEDVNFIRIEPGQYDLIFAHAVVHHVINMEHLFEQIAAGLSDQGLFHLVDVVGKNRKLLWDDNERFANALLDAIPAEFTNGVRIAVREHEEGMEGVRQEDTVPMLKEYFEPVFELRHGAYIRFICTNAKLGVSLDPRTSEAKRYLDFLISCDDAAVEHSVLRPLEIWGVYRAKREE